MKKHLRPIDTSSDMSGSDNRKSSVSAIGLGIAAIVAVVGAIYINSNTSKDASPAKKKEEKAKESKRYDTIVIGCGPFGAATAKYIALNNGEKSVLCIGPTPSKSNPYSAHFDISRLYRVQHATGFWSTVSRASIGRYNEIAAGGDKFHKEVGYVGLSVYDSQWRKDYGEGLPYPVEGVNIGIPSHATAADVQIFHQKEGAGFLDPLKMVEAQLRIFSNAGGRIVRDLVTRIEENEYGVFQVLTQNGEEYSCKKVLLCNGCFVNTVPISLKADKGVRLTLVKNLVLRTQSVVLFEISEEDIPKLPCETIVYGGKTKGGEIELKCDSSYSVPPLKYADGKYYLKMGHGQELEETINSESVSAIKQWYDGSGGLDQEIYANMTEIFTWMFPNVKPLSKQIVRNGITTHSDSGKVLMEMLKDTNLGYVTACNGYGAKGSDEIGRLAAEMLKNVK